MKNLKLSILLFMAIIGLTGCPYGSSYPLDEQAKILVDNLLIGQWKGSDIVGDGLTWDFQISTNSKFKYDIIVTNSKGEVEKYIGYESELKKDRIMNLVSTDIHETTEVTFWKFSTNDKEMQITWIDDQNLESYVLQSSQELRKLFENEYDDLGFYDNKNSFKIYKE